MKSKTLLSSIALLAGVATHCSAALVGHWTFEGANPLADSAGNFGDLALGGDASITGGALDVNGGGSVASGWATSPSTGGGLALGPNKTLVSWITLQSLSDVAVAGSALTLDSVSVDQFDGIVFGERQTNRWMNGSNGFTRSPEPEFAGANAVATIGGPVQLAISYDSGSGQITGYLDGVSMGSYAATLVSWGAGDQEVSFGVRHINNAAVSPPGPGALDALIHEARIYDTVLDGNDLQALTMVPEPSVSLLGVLAAGMVLTRRRRTAPSRRSDG